MQRGSLKVKRNRRGVKVWRAQWREDGRGRTRILGRCSDLSRDEAKAELKRIVAPVSARAASARISNAVDIATFLESEYLTVKSRVWKDSTRRTTEQIIQTHIVADLGRRALNSVTRRELQAHLDKKASSGLSSSVVGHIRWQLVAVFEMAEGDGLVTANPTKGLVMPKCEGTVDKRVIKIPDIHRAQLVLPIRERLIFRLAVCEGMRPGEITSLQLGDLRPDGIHIERRVYRGKIDTPKSWRSRRVVPPTETTGMMLASYIELLQDISPTAWLFGSEKKTPLNYAGVYRRIIQPALGKIGLGATNFQVLRRTWVTELSQTETDPKVRAELAGHSVDVHENEYRQPDSDVLKRAMQNLGKRLQ